MRCFGLRLPGRPRDSRASRISRARSFADSDRQRRPIATPACASAIHGTARSRSRLDLLAAARLDIAAMVALAPGGVRPRELGYC
jgi:hypothetical protein